MIDVRRNVSRGVLVRMAVVAALLIAGIVWAWGPVYSFYLRDQLTRVGIVINGAIVALFLLGMGRITGNLWRYMREETWLARFVQRLEEGSSHPAEGIPRQAIIVRRYAAILRISKQHAPVNHNALASMLLAEESTRLSFPKFVNNVLILLGVFGTIVSLSIALVGASDLLAGQDQVSNMNLVIHGMATALSTTMTAIVCYLVHGYFYLKLTDAQTHLLSAVEQVTSVYLMPLLATDPEGIIQQVGHLVRSLRETVRGMHAAQLDFAQAGEQLRELLERHAGVLEGLGRDVRAIHRDLREGFRLPLGEGAEG